MDNLHQPLLLPIDESSASDYIVGELSFDKTSIFAVSCACGNPPANSSVQVRGLTGARKR